MNKKVLLICLASLFLLPWIGATSNVSDKIFFEIRMPRVLIGIAVGALLGLTGYLYQLIFRNPLATPYTLGVASAASLGAVSTIAFFPMIIPSAGGIIGAFLVCLIFITVFKAQYLADRVILFGVVLGLFLSSLTVVIQYIASGSEVFRIVHWLLGSLQVTSFSLVVLIFLVFFVLLCLSLRFSTELSLIAIGDEYAKSKGVESESINWLFFIVVSLAIGLCVSFFGPIGFVGLAVPFMARRMSPYNFNSQIIWSGVLGAVFLAWSDALGRVITYPLEVPAGVVTAIFGAPLVAYSLFRQNS